MPKRVFAVVFSALDCARREASSSGGKRSEGSWKGEVVGADFERVEDLLVGSVLSSSAVGFEGAGVLEGWRMSFVVELSYSSEA